MVRPTRMLSDIWQLRLSIEAGSSEGDVRVLLMLRHGCEHTRAVKRGGARVSESVRASDS